MLYLVATPIGNLKDMTYRAVETLQACDYILCEDTRHSLILLKHYQIQKPLKSYHKFSEISKESSILNDLKEGKSIALISDAGTPGISDPGTKLVQACIENEIKVTAIPGPCAAITALSCSGLDTDLFQFYGFLPRKQQSLISIIKEILRSKFTSICYESPHRITDVLKVIHDLAPNHSLVIARELTKKFEEVLRGTSNDLIQHFTLYPPKGEIILLISGQKEIPHQDWSSMSEIEHVEWLKSQYSLSRNEAIKMAAELRGVPKRNIYNKIVKSI